MSESLFVYGTLMNPLIQQRVFGRVTPGEPETLAGYGKDYIRLGGGVYPIIRPEPGSVVEGRRLQVTPAELRLIDRYEGPAYRRVRVRLVSGREVWVYTALLAGQAPPRPKPSANEPKRKLLACVRSWPGGRERVDKRLSHPTLAQSVTSV